MERERSEPGRESVWDYPRPPKLEEVAKRVKVVFGEVTLAYTGRPKRVLETSHPPVYYLPKEDVEMEHLEPTERTSFCEFKGRARYYRIVTRQRVVENAAWEYPEPTPGYEGLEGYITFYPGLMDNCWVDGEKVGAQEGYFYGGWITSEIQGPFKGAPGTGGW